MGTTCSRNDESETTLSFMRSMFDDGHASDCLTRDRNASNVCHRNYELDIRASYRTTEGNVLRQRISRYPDLAVCHLFGNTGNGNISRLDLQCQLARCSRTRNAAHNSRFHYLEKENINRKNRGQYMRCWQALAPYLLRSDSVPHDPLIHHKDQKNSWGI